MNVKRFTRVCLALIAGLVLAVAPQVTLGQGGTNPGAGGKITGDRYWPAKATGRYIETARNYAQDVQSYLATAAHPEPSVVKDIKTDLGHYLADSQKHLATMKKDFAADKETVAAIDSIEKGLAAAVAHHKAAVACCEDQKFEKVATMACCTDLVKQLDKVHGEHVALMKTLSHKYPAPAAAAK